MGIAYAVAAFVPSLYLSITQPHPLPGVGVATGVLAVAWLAVAAMAWRAAMNRRFDSHRGWMIRSYLLGHAADRLRNRPTMARRFAAQSVT